MSHDTIIIEIKQMLSDITYIEINDLDENASLLGDLSVSSMELLQLVSSIENKYSIKISEKELRTFANINDIVSFVLEKINND